MKREAELAFVDASRDVASRCAQTHPQHDGAGHEGAAVGGGEESEAGEDEGDAGHEEDLSSVSEED